MSKSNDSFTLPALLDREIVFEESLLKIQRDRLQIDQQPPYNYYSLLTPPLAVCVLATTSDGAYVLNEEYRHPTGRILLGCPSGFVDPGEDALEAARRELLEETGFQAQTYQIIGQAFPYAGFSGQKTIFIRAQGAALSNRPSLEVSEVIHPCLLMPGELTQAIQSGADVDATLCAALFFSSLN